MDQQVLSSQVIMIALQQSLVLVRLVGQAPPFQATRTGPLIVQASSKKLEYCQAYVVGNMQHGVQVQSRWGDSSKRLQAQISPCLLANAAALKSAEVHSAKSPIRYHRQGDAEHVSAKFVSFCTQDVGFLQHIAYL